MKSVFEYLDYREYLAAFYEHHKAHTKGFSYRSFLQSAKISSPSFLKQVIDKQRKLTASTTQKFLNALELSPTESEYFKLSVSYTHAVLNEDKQSAYKKMRDIARSQDLKIIGSECYDYYEHWYTSALRELLTMRDFQDDWKTIASQLSPPIKAKQAQAATQTLLDLGFLQRDSQGKYHQTNTTISTGLEVNSLSIRNFNAQCIDLAQKALKDLPKDQRHVTGITMGVSESAYTQITHEIESLQAKILDILKEDQNQSKVVQFNTLLFPLSQQSKPQVNKDKQ